jgi:hypothetical protein
LFFYIARFKSSSWGETEFLPQVNNQDYTKALSGFDLSISVLAFHYALLARSETDSR